MLPLTYHWQQTGGPAVSFSPALSLTTFTAPTTTTALTFTLTVTDVLGLASAPNETIVYAEWPDLQITQATMPVFVAPGQPVTYTLAFANVGTDRAIGVVITDAMPLAAITDLAYLSTGAAITDTGHVPSYAWQVQDLPPGEGGVITITGIITPALEATHSFSNTAAITSLSRDLTFSNNTLRAEFTALVTDTPPALVNNTGMAVAAGITGSYFACYAFGDGYREQPGIDHLYLANSPGTWGSSPGGGAAGGRRRLLPARH